MVPLSPLPYLGSFGPLTGVMPPVKDNVGLTIICYMCKIFLTRERIIYNHPTTPVRRRAAPDIVCPGQPAPAADRGGAERRAQLCKSARSGAQGESSADPYALEASGGCGIGIQQTGGF